MKIYSNLEWLKLHPELPVTVMLYPFTGIYAEPLHDERSPLASRFDDYCADPTPVVMVGPREAEYFVFPFEWYGLGGLPEKEALFSEFFAEASTHGKQGLVFAYGDERVDLSRFPNAIVFQSNLRRSELGPVDRAMPTFVEDLVANGSPGSPRSASWRRRLGFRPRPTASFCGFPGSDPLREQVLALFARSREVAFRYRQRNSYYGGAWDKKVGSYDFVKLRTVRREYVRSLLSADYVLCPRGWGNYSARFYEALCCGKIPVLFDTDCVLPFEGNIDYERAIFRLKPDEFARADKLLAEFDCSLSDAEFLARQSLCRQIWLDWLSPQGFFRNLQHVLASTVSRAA